ncbi:MAG: hypothetical protein IJ804_06610 [Prevotella sp.]|nr:hypothetical protein [Prevotella sp.]
MKKRVLVFFSALFISSLLVTNAQTSLAGRSYHHPNIMADAMKDATKDLDKKIAEAKKKAIAEGEKKKGRKLTAEETAKIDKVLKEKVEQINAIKKGMKTAITIEFIDDKKIVLKPDIKINDDALKAAGMGWLKRKALKAALALAPKSEKGTYIVKGDMIIMTDSDNEKDTMTISKDGKFLYGKFDEKTPFKLTRTK